MRFQDLPVSILSFRLKSNDAIPYAKSGEPLPVKKIEPSESILGEFDLFVHGAVIHASSADKSSSARLDSELAQGRAHLAQIEPQLRDGSFELRVAFFFQRHAEMGDVEVAVDEYVAGRFKDLYKAFRCNDVDAVRRQMQEDFNYKHGNEEFFFIISGSALDSDLDLSEFAEYRDSLAAWKRRVRKLGVDDAGEKPIPPETNDVSATADSFGIVGRDAFFAASRRALDGIGDVFVASKMTRRENRSGRNVRLARGKLAFSDMTQTGGIAAAARVQVRALSQESSTYLKKWDEYGDEEGRFLLEKARSYGILSYVDAEPDLDETTTVRLVGSSAGEAAFAEMAVRGMESVELVTDAPSYLMDPEMTFEEFVDELMAENREQRISGEARKEKKAFKVVRFNEGTNKLTIKAHGLPPSGQFILSIGGEVTQIKRRVDTRRRIRDCESANPQLALILEPGAKPTSTRLPSKQIALNASVKKKVFPKNPPTDKQEKAIDIAINTPDIALIQGPPGTGKTTVITAIVERLNQILTV